MGSDASALPAVAAADRRGPGGDARRSAWLGVDAHAGHFRRDWRTGPGHFRRRRARSRPLHRLHVRVRGDLDPDHRGDGRRRHPRPKASRMNTALIPLEYYLMLSGLLFTIGTAG